MGDSDGPGKLEEVKALLADLRDGFASEKFSEDDLYSTLEELKIHGRDPTDADPLFERGNVELLTKYAFNGKSVKTSREALRVLANALLLKAPTRQIFVDLQGPSKLLQMPHAFDTIDDEFLCSRILFLLTYTDKIDYEALVSEYHLDEKISQALIKHAQPREGKVLPLLREMALEDTLKLLFNITHFSPATVPSFTSSTAPIFRLFKKLKPSPLQPLQKPATHMLNALMNLEYTVTNPGPFVLGDAESVQVADVLIKFLDEATAKQPSKELDVIAVPLVTVMRKLYETGSPDVQLRLQTECLPQEADRSKPLGKTESLPSRLLRLSVAQECPNLGIALSFLLFTLSDSDPETFVRNVGFGFASGFLMNNRLPVPAEGGEGARSDVDFVTGQFLKDVETGPEIDMTDDEKEREAERLFVLFERLRATGVVDVENPIRVAAQEGRLQEIESDEE